MDHIQMAIALADDDGDGHVSHVEFLNSLHTLHDNTQKHDAWAIKLKAFSLSLTLTQAIHSTNVLT